MLLTALSPSGDNLRVVLTSLSAYSYLQQWCHTESQIALKWQFSSNRKVATFFFSWSIHQRTVDKKCIYKNWSLHDKLMCKRKDEINGKTFIMNRSFSSSLKQTTSLSAGHGKMLWVQLYLLFSQLQPSESNTKEGRLTLENTKGWKVGENPSVPFRSGWHSATTLSN